MNLFIIMFPFFFFTGIIFLFTSFYFLILNFSFFFHWSFFIGSFSISFPFYLDYMSCIFMGMVLIISGSIMYYSEFYMESEFYKFRFFFLMFFFVLSMIFLILSPNFICMLLGWDGLGLISYGLVIYYQNFKAFSSGMITALTNRIGDAFILISITMCFNMGGWSYMNFLSFENVFLLSFFFFVASLTKSAQIPFSAWLPAAMAAPTPVSSLVHSSTLVTAGVYIMIRFEKFLSSGFKFTLLIISLLTMVMSGLAGLLEFDLKKIIALSTLSQLGFMMSTISLGLSDLSFFHLVTHASFKALLFMCAGFFIHVFSDNQDIRNFGLLSKDFSFSLCMFNTANLSLAGFPFLSGFFSKDLILELMIKSKMNFFFFFLFIFGTFLTVFYSFRLFFFLTYKKLFFFPVSHSVKTMGIQNSMFFLFFFSIALGYLGSKLFFFPYNYIVLPFFLKILITFICLMSFFFSSYYSFFYSLYFNKLVYFMSQMWFLNFLKTDFVKPSLYFSFCVSKTLIGFVEMKIGLKNVYFFLNLSYLFNRVLISFFFSFMFFMSLFFFIFFMFFC